MRNDIAMQRIMDAVETAVFEDDGDENFADCAFAEVAGYRAYFGKDK